MTMVPFIISPVYRISSASLLSHKISTEMELEEAIEYYHPNVSDRIPDHILWVRHHTKLLPGKLCLSGNCMVLCRYQRIYDDLPGFCNRTEDKGTFKPQVITHGITRIRHLSEPLCICIHCLRFTGYRVAAVYCTNYLYGLYCIPDMLRHRLANVKKQIDQSLHPVT